MPPPPFTQTLQGRVTRLSNERAVRSSFLVELEGRALRIRLRVRLSSRAHARTVEWRQDGQDEQPWQWAEITCPVVLRAAQGLEAPAAEDEALLALVRELVGAMYPGVRWRAVATGEAAQGAGAAAHLN